MNNGLSNLSDVARQLDPASGLFPTATLSYLHHGKPRSCTVVLRNLDRNNWSFSFFTDRRSIKFKALLARAQVSLCLYSRDLLLQAVLEGNVSIHTQDAEADKYWQETADKSLFVYRQVEIPGEDLPAPFLKDKTDLLSLPQARQHFCVVNVHCSHLDLLQIATTGNRRYLVDLESTNPQLKPVAP